MNQPTTLSTENATAKPICQPHISGDSTSTSCADDSGNFSMNSFLQSQGFQEPPRPFNPSCSKIPMFEDDDDDRSTPSSQANDYDIINWFH